MRRFWLRASESGSGSGFLYIVIHYIFNWVGAQAQIIHLIFPFPVDKRFDQVRGEDIVLQ